MTSPYVFTDVADVLERLPSLVLAHRRRQGLSQRGAAAQIGVSPSTLCRVETGVGMLDIPNTIKVLRWLGGES